ncbi:MAG: siroheme synthase CysG [Pseudomonadota bacterium]
MDYYPIFVDLRAKPCLVVGGGSVALRKTKALLSAHATVTVVAPDLEPELSHLAEQGLVTHLAHPFSDDLVLGKFLVIAATDRLEVNTSVYQTATKQGCLVNSVDDPKRSNFITPAIVDRSPIVIAISSGGSAPVLARRIRAKLETELPKRLGQLANLAQKYRQRVKKIFSNISARRKFWEMTLTGPVADAMFRGDSPEATRLLEQSLTSPQKPANGTVGLVGAGPGDKGLLTLRGFQWLQTADVILYDRLVSNEVLELARRDADLVFVGKKPGCHQVTQEQIIEKLINWARQGKKVCRLKGGDPFVFGRGGEELEALQQAQIQYEVVPGITAAVGAAAYSGIPLTHRDHASSVRFVTAHCKKSLDCLDWNALAKEKQTLVFYMGVAKLETLQKELIRHGLTATTPIAFVENATRQEQRVATGTLGTLFSTAERYKIVSPSVLVVGEVAKLGNQLAWFGVKAGNTIDWQAATGT